MDLKGKSVLVTGGAGFIGSHMVAKLIELGARVSIIDNLSTGSKGNVHPEAAFYEMDINDERIKEVFEKEHPEIVYLMAFNTNVPKSVTDPAFDAMSLIGNVRVMQAAVAAGVKHIVFSSTSFVYGNTNVLPTPETEPARAENAYMISKSTCENYLRFFRSVHKINGVILRYATTYGEGQVKGAMADYIRCIAAGKSAVIYGDGTKTRPYTYVGDIVRGNLMALDFNTPGVEPTFNIGTSKETTLNEVYGKLAKLLNRPDAKPEYVPDRPGEMMRSSLDASKAKQYLGWEPEVDLDEGLRRTVAYFLSHNK